MIKAVNPADTFEFFRQGLEQHRTNKARSAGDQYILSFVSLVH